jgi:glucose/mannose transport system substrate-binding protein
MNGNRRWGAWGIVVFAGLLASGALAGQVDVLHWWTSGGEAAAVAELRKRLEAAGHQWRDRAVVGGGGESAMIALRARLIAGDPPPAAAQIKGPDIQEWAERGLLANLDAIATAEHWDRLLPAEIARLMHYDGHYVAVPFNIHRVNWLWVNLAIFQKAGAEIPTTWADFERAARKIQQAGFIPVAQGGQPWQEATLFESVVLGVGGAAFYRKAFVDLDLAALASPTMAQAFATLRTVKQYTDLAAPGRDWNRATNLVIQGQAAMQFMGDWAKGEFAVAGRVPDRDYRCVPVPGTQGTFSYNVDSFVMFQIEDPEVQAAQTALAHIVMDPEFQERFNLKKGSIPARLGARREPFDACARAALADLAASAQAGTLVPSMSQGMAVPSALQGAIFDVVTVFYNSALSSQDAAKQLAQAVAAHR